MSPQLQNLKDRTITRLYTLGEETVHSITHGIGAGLSIAGLTLVVVLAEI